MVIGFNKQFPDKIIAGTKLHTIREDSKNRWRAGMTMHMATGVRTKNYKCFKLDTCTGTQKIRILHRDTTVVIIIDNLPFAQYDTFYLSGINVPELVFLAKKDGFESLEAFLEWFNKDYAGKIIHWTDLRY